MPIMTFLPEILFSVLLAASPPVTACQTAAYVIDPDPKGLNVRSGPGSQNKLLATLPTVQAEPAVKVDVQVTGFSQGWLRISQAYDLYRKPLLKQAGWVHAPLLGTSTRTSPNRKVSLYSSPGAKAVAQIPDLSQVSILSCKGNWLEVKHGNHKGWLRPQDQCAISETTCN